MLEQGYQVEPSSQRDSRKRSFTRRKAFTFVEIFIVVMVVGIIATVVIPQFTTSSQRSRQNTLKEELNCLRTQIAVYKAQHQDVPPGYARGNPMSFPRQEILAAQLTMHTDLHGNTSPQAFGPYGYGPYLSALPANPVNRLNTCTMIGNNNAVPAPDGTTGWIYKPQTQEIIPNLVGTDTVGNAYSNY